MPGASTDHNFVTAIPSKGETEDELPGFRFADPRNVDFDMFSRARFADYALHHKTARGYVESPEQHLADTLKYMDQANVRVGVVSGSNESVQGWRTKHPDRFLAGFHPDLSLESHADQAEKFASEARQGKWQTLGELSLPYFSRP